MGTIAFLCAMPMELRPLAKRLGLRTARLGEVEVRAGALGGHEVVAIVTGMGTHLAALATERLLGAVTPDHVMVVGITGAVDDDTPIGTVIVPEVVVHSETGSEHRPAPLGDATPRGTMWTTNRITPPEELPDLRARGVVALDMETAAIAACCEQRGVPWAVRRAVSDRATDATLDDEVFRLANQDGTANPAAIARYVVRHPGRLPRLAAVARDARLATVRAASAAISAVSEL